MFFQFLMSVLELNNEQFSSMLSNLGSDIEINENVVVHVQDDRLMQ